MVGKKGRLWTFDKNPNTTTKTTVLNIENVVYTAGDAGMLGATFHPEFGQAGSPNRGYIYVFYRKRGPSSSGRAAYLILSRFNMPDGSNVFDRNSEYVLIQQYDRHDWHNGGGMFFGLDGFLYLSIGDEGGANDQYNSSQKLNVGLLGGALRIDVDQDPSRSHPIRRQPLNPATPPAGWPNSFSQGYYIPDDNPWQSPTGSHLEEFYAIGFRSPHRMTQDPVTGDIWMGDIGQGSREEVSLVPKGSNLQWPYKEGKINGPKAKPTNLIGFDQPPVHDYPRNVGVCVIGGFVYRGNKWPSLYGKYLFGDHTTRKVWSIDRNPLSNTYSLDFLTNIPSFGSGSKNGISSFATDANGEIYVLKLFGTNLDGGRIYKLQGSNPVPDPPQLLSQTGVFADLATLTPVSGIVPYTVNAPLWSDGSEKKRWVAIPNDGSHNSATEKINFSQSDFWQFPQGTVFIKHFEMPTDESDPSQIKRLETRFMIRDKNGGLYGLTYKWNDAGTDATLINESETIPYTINKLDGSQENRTWTFPSRADCMTCHNQSAGGILGFNTHQLNRELEYPSGIVDNQLRTLNHLGWFSPAIDENDISTFLKSEHILDPTANLETRIRSYLDGNCAHCHQPSGVNANFDTRFPIQLGLQNIINGDLSGSYGIPDAAVVKPGEKNKSILYIRDNSVGTDMMPPLAKSIVDEPYIKALETWIGNLASGNSPNCTASFIPKSGWSLHFRDSEESGYEAVKAIDGDPNTMWHTEWRARSPLHPHEIQINLGQSYPITGLRYLPRQTGNLNGTIKDFEIYVSTDGTNWGAPVSSGTWANNRNEKESLFAAVDGQYIRLRSLAEVNGNPWSSAAEINVLQQTCLGPGGNNLSPTALFTASEFFIEGGKQIDFDATASSDPENDPLTYSWDFGDGQSEQGATTSHTFMNEGVYYITLTVSDNQGNSNSNLCQVRVKVPTTFLLKLNVFLEGPYNSGNELMNSAILDQISLNDPYGMGQQALASLFNTNGNDEIVDWMLVELRDPDDATTVLASKAVLLERDGDIVGDQGEEFISFPVLGQQAFYVVLRHYNHLAVMTQSPVSMSSLVLIDFSDPGTPIYTDGGQAMRTLNGTRLMWAGDANNDEVINATDKNTFWRVQNGTGYLYGTNSADFNLDGAVNAVDKNLYWRVNNSRVSQIP